MTTPRRRRERSDRSLRFDMQAGTHKSGVAGTVSFKDFKFAGTPTVVLTLLAGTTRWGRASPFKVANRYSGSFTYAGSPGGGTFNWLAYGPVA